MNDQRDLFGDRYPDRPGAVRGSDTSEHAAESVEHDVSRLRGMVYNFISACEHGATCDETESRLFMRHQTCSARIRELVIRGKLYDTGERRLTRSKRPARVYRVS